MNALHYIHAHQQPSIKTFYLTGMSLEPVICGRLCKEMLPVSVSGVALFTTRSEASLIDVVSIAEKSV